MTIWSNLTHIGTVRVLRLSPIVLLSWLFKCQGSTLSLYSSLDDVYPYDDTEVSSNHSKCFQMPHFLWRYRRLRICFMASRSPPSRSCPALPLDELNLTLCVRRGGLAHAAVIDIQLSTGLVLNPPLHPDRLCPLHKWWGGKLLLMSLHQPITLGRCVLVRAEC